MASGKTGGNGQGSGKAGGGSTSRIKTYTEAAKVVLEIFKALQSIDKALNISGTVSSWFSAIWSKLRGLDGKKIGVIGPTASGKNSLIARLQGGRPTGVYAQTRGAETVDRYRIEFAMPRQEPIRFWANKSLNVGGEIDERERFWADACRDADIVFYVVDINKLSGPEAVALTRFDADMSWLRSEGLGGAGRGSFKSDMKLGSKPNQPVEAGEVF